MYFTSARIKSACRHRPGWIACSRRRLGQDCRSLGSA